MYIIGLPVTESRGRPLRVPHYKAQLYRQRRRKWNRRLVDCAAHSFFPSCDIPDDSDCTDDFWMEDYATPAAPSFSSGVPFTLAQLLVKSPQQSTARPVKRRRTRSRTTSDISSRYFDDDKLVSPVSVTEAATEQHQPIQTTEDTRPDDDSTTVRSRASDESQRIFLISGRLDELVEEFNAHQTYLSPFCHGPDGEDGRIAFMDVGLTVHIVLLVKPTLFGLEISLKAPRTWLVKLPELVGISDVLKIFFPVKRASTVARAGNDIEKCFTIPGDRLLRSDILRETCLKTQPDSLSTVIPSSSCPICWDVGDVFWNVCGHGACLSCWRLLIVAKVSEGVAQLTCMVPRCGLPVPGSLVGLCAPWHTVEAWQNQQLNVLVTTRQAKFCRNAQCNGIFFPHQVRISTNFFNSFFSFSNFFKSKLFLSILIPAFSSYSFQRLYSSYSFFRCYSFDSFLNFLHFLHFYSFFLIFLILFLIFSNISSFCFFVKKKF